MPPFVLYAPLAARLVKPEDGEKEAIHKRALRTWQEKESASREHVAAGGTSWAHKGVGVSSGSVSNGGRDVGTNAKAFRGAVGVEGDELEQEQPSGVPDEDPECERAQGGTEPLLFSFPLSHIGVLLARAHRRPTSSFLCRSYESFTPRLQTRKISSGSSWRYCRQPSELPP